MFKKIALCLAICAVLLVGALTPAQADPIPVDLRLALLVDVSGSIDSGEFNLQKQGYIDAFTNSAVINAITSQPIGSIAVSLVYWSGIGQQNTAVDWTLVSDATSAQAFATAIDNSSRPYSGLTSISGALDYATNLFATDSTFVSSRDVIDISGDGINNDPSDISAVQQASADAVAAGIIINGLPIGSQTVTDYYQDYVIGGSGAFVIASSTFADFGDAIQDKLVTEISGVPEPGTMLLAASAMGIMGVIRRRRRKEEDE